jgi:hypothetical protein
MMAMGLGFTNSLAQQQDTKVRRWPKSDGRSGGDCGRQAGASQPANKLPAPSNRQQQVLRPSSFGATEALARTVAVAVTRCVAYGLPCYLTTLSWYVCPGLSIALRLQPAACHSSTDEPTPAVPVAGAVDSTAAAAQQLSPASLSPGTATPVPRHLLQVPPEIATLTVLVKQAMKQARAKPFLRPVAELFAGQPWLHDYMREIKYPMDLGTLSNKLQAGAYGSDPPRALRDLGLIWQNCLQFNGAHDANSKKAVALRGYFETQLAASARSVAVKREKLVTASQRQRGGAAGSQACPSNAPPTQVCLVGGNRPEQESNLLGELRRENAKLRSENAKMRQALTTAELERRTTLSQQQRRPEWWELAQLGETLGRLDHYDPQGFEHVMRILSRHPVMRTICKQLDTSVDEDRTFDLELLSTADFNELRDYADKRMHRHLDRERAQRESRPRKRQRGAAGGVHSAMEREQLFRARAAELQRERHTARGSLDSQLDGSSSDSDSDSDSDDSDSD